MSQISSKVLSSESVDSEAAADAAEDLEAALRAARP